MGDYPYGFSGNQPGILVAMEFKTGKVAWKDRSVTKGNCKAVPRLPCVCFRALDYSEALTGACSSAVGVVTGRLDMRFAANRLTYIDSLASGSMYTSETETAGVIQKTGAKTELKNTRRSRRRRNTDAARPPKPLVAVTNFREDRLFPRIERAVAAILHRAKVVAPVDVLVEMELLAPEHLEDWRRGRVPYLERVIRCNRTKLSRILRILRFHAHDLNLVPSVMAYMRWGKGPKLQLQFTKWGNPKLEEAYARHFVWPGKAPFRFRPEGSPDVSAE